MKFTIFWAALVVALGFSTSCGKKSKKDDPSLPYRVASLEGSEISQMNSMIFYVNNPSKFRALLNSRSNWASKAEFQGDLFHKSELNHSEAYLNGQTVCQIHQNEEFERDYPLDDLKEISYGKIASVIESFDSKLNSQTVVIGSDLQEYNIVCSKKNLKQPFSFEQVADALSSIIKFEIDQTQDSPFDGFSGSIPRNSKDIVLTILDKDKLLDILNDNRIWLKGGEIVEARTIENRRTGICTVRSNSFSRLTSNQQSENWLTFKLLKYDEVIAEERDFSNLQLFFEGNPFSIICEKEALYPSFDWRFLNESFNSILKFEHQPQPVVEGEGEASEPTN